jgi:hypothetical protein
MIGRVPCHFALLVGPGTRFVGKLDIFEKEGRNGVYLLVGAQIGEVYKVEV